MHVITGIEGKGAIVFLCKNGEHRSFAGAYYIPRLTTNIVSIGQLDEEEHQGWFDEGSRTRRTAPGEGDAG